MRVWKSEEEYDLGRCVVALGMFDGVHIGHQALIRRAQALAKEMEAACVVYTFDRHPLALLCPDSAPRQLLAMEERLEKLSLLGVDGALVKPFTREYAATAPEDFLDTLVRRMQVRGIVAGFNYSFGAGGRGNAGLLRREAARLGYTLEIVEAVTDRGDTVSSTLIRSLLEAGEEARAERLLALQMR